MRKIWLGIGMGTAVIATACAHPPVQSGVTPSPPTPNTSASKVGPQYVVDGTTAPKPAAGENALYVIDGVLLTNPTPSSAATDKATPVAPSATPLYIIDGVPIDQPPATPHR